MVEGILMTFVLSWLVEVFVSICHCLLVVVIGVLILLGVESLRYELLEMMFSVLS